MERRRRILLSLTLNYYIKDTKLICAPQAKIFWKYIVYVHCTSRLRRNTLILLMKCRLRRNTFMKMSPAAKHVHDHEMSPAAKHVHEMSPVAKHVHEISPAAKHVHEIKKLGGGLATSVPTRPRL